jgi:hypothetical protein
MDNSGNSSTSNEARPEMYSSKVDGVNVGLAGTGRDGIVGIHALPLIVLRAETG